MCGGGGTYLPFSAVFAGVRRRSSLPLGMDFYSVTKSEIYGEIVLRLVTCLYVMFVFTATFVSSSAILQEVIKKMKKMKKEIWVSGTEDYCYVLIGGHMSLPLIGYAPTLPCLIPSNPSCCSSLPVAALSRIA